MDFGDVIKEMKAHPEKRFARRGWNGRDMFIYLAKGGSASTASWRPESGITMDEYNKGYIIIKPHIDMCNAQGERIIGWLASQTDMLADDWEELSPFNTPEEQRQRITECKNRMFEELKDHVPGMFCLGYHPTRNSINDHGWMMAYTMMDVHIDCKDIRGNALAGPPQYSAYGLYFRIEKETYLKGLLSDILSHRWDGPMPQLAPCEEVKE